MGDSAAALLPVLYDPPPGFSAGTQDYDPITQQLLSTREVHADALQITFMKELKRDPEASTILVEVACEGVRYESADNACIFPENTEEEVRELAALQGYELDRVFAFQGPRAPFPTPCSVRQALLRHCDITSLVKKKFLKDLAHYATQPEEKDTLLTLGSLKGKADFKSRIQDAYLHLTDLLKLFPSVRVPVGDLVQLLGRVQPRYFTIASSAKANPNALQFVLSVQKTVTFDGYVKTGLCSGYIQALFHTAVYKPIHVAVKPSRFRLPASPVPLIFICNGAGLAPFRAFLHEMRAADSLSFPSVLLFYGCRSRDSHFLFRKEIEEALRPCQDPPLPYEYRSDRQPVSPVLSHAFCAFSRDQPSKVYVQNALAANEELVWDLVANRDASLFVCG